MMLTFVRRITFTLATSGSPNEFLAKMNLTGTGVEALIASIDRVEFYQDGELLEITQGGDFETTWLAPAPGTYTFEARIDWPGNAHLTNCGLMSKKTHRLPTLRICLLSFRTECDTDWLGEGKVVGLTGALHRPSG
jgi:hypothetical protein